jgi:hypothetical protein
MKNGREEKGEKELMTEKNNLKKREKNEKRREKKQKRE